MSTILSTILYAALMILDTQILSLKLNKNPVTGVKLPEKAAHVYEDNPMYPSHLRLEYVPHSDGLKVVINPNYETEPKEFPLKSRLLVAPAHKFAFCYIEKVGCTQFNLLMNRINGIKTGNVWYRSNYDNAMHNITFEDITRENGWFKGIFVREPQHRFLSAFNSKCLPGHDHDPHNRNNNCLIEPLPLHGFNTERAKLLFHKATTYLKENYTTGNPHFDTMTSFCGGLSKDLSDYDYVGHLDRGYADVQQQVAEMLGKRNISFGADFATIFPKERPRDKHMTSTNSEYEEFYNDADRENVKNYYASDYALLSTLEELGK